MQISIAGLRLRNCFPRPSSAIVFFTFFLCAQSASAQTTFWNLFNAEMDDTDYATYVTYSTLDDMLNDTNRTGIYFPFYGGDGQKVVGSASDGEYWWSLLNVQGETGTTAQFAVYDSLEDMLEDTGRIFTVNNSNPELANAIGTGADVNSYWMIFNVEDEGASSSEYVTYATFSDMLQNLNRTGVYTKSGDSRALVGTGSTGGFTYWSLFNPQGEGSLPAIYVTYNSEIDMLNDTNRAGVYYPDGGNRPENVIGSGMSPPGC